MATPNCEYGGIKNVYLRTYTKTYPYLDAGWTFNPNSIQPMEFAGYTDASLSPIGLQFQLIDAATGYTSLKAGDLTGTLSPNNGFVFAPLCYDPDDEAALGFIIQGSKEVLLARYDISFGDAPRVLGSMGLVTGKTLPNLANTQFFDPDAGMNWIANNGLYGSYVETLNPFSMAWGGDFYPPTIVTAAQTGFTSLEKFYRALPLEDSNQNTVWLDSTAGGMVVHNALITDFGGSPVQFVKLVMENPPGTLDVDALFAMDTNTTRAQATYAGFLGMYNDTQTIDGVTMHGYGILVAADLTSYVVLNIMPQDVDAAAWNAFGATKQAKVDRNGSVWINNPNLPHVLYNGPLTLPVTHKPVFPPINLPINSNFYK